MSSGPHGPIFSDPGHKSGSKEAVTSVLCQLKCKYFISQTIAKMSVTTFELNPVPCILSRFCFLHTSRLYLLNKYLLALEFLSHSFNGNGPLRGNITCIPSLQVWFLVKINHHGDCYECGVGVGLLRSRHEKICGRFPDYTAHRSYLWKQGKYK